jgi:hypothetical protein
MYNLQKKDLSKTYLLFFGSNYAFFDKSLR